MDERAARLQETVSRAQCEKATLEEQVASLQQENKVSGTELIVDTGVGRESEEALGSDLVERSQRNREE